MLPIVLFVALEVGIIPVGLGVVDQSLIMPEYALYQAVELEIVAYQHVFVGGSARLYEWNDKDGCWPVEATAVVFAGIRVSPFEIGWRYHFPDQPISSFPISGMFLDQQYHEVYFRMDSGNLLK